MGVMATDKKTSRKYSFFRKAGRSIIEHRPVFSPDGESLALIVENIVRVYNIQTGDCVRILETESESSPLIAIYFPENEDYNLYGCSITGSVTIWTWEKGAVLKEFNLQLPKSKKVVSFNLIDQNECFVTSLPNRSSHLQLGTFSVKSGQLIQDLKDTRPEHFDLVRVSVGLCHEDRYAAIINGTKTLYIQNLNKPHRKSEITSIHSLRLISVAAHQKENMVAISDALGVVTIIKGNLYDHRQTVKEVLHWHSLPLLDVCFSAQGNYLFSGGLEKVLVKWTLGSLASKAQEKSFIPRLPGVIRFVTTNNTHIAVTLTNNSVVIASAQMRVLSTILECGGLSPLARAVGSSLVYHKNTGALLMGGRAGHLQLYSTNTDKVLYNIDITETNAVPSERHNLLPLETEVTCVAVSSSGSWLVTSEYRNDGISYPEERLKFWLMKMQGVAPFKLNTCVNLAHGGCHVVSLALNDKGEFCVSAGADQKFRVWKRDTSTKNTFSWSCLTACYYSSGVAHFLSHDILNNFKNRDRRSLNDTSYLRKINRKKDIIARLFNVHKEHNLIEKDVINSGMKRNDDYDMGGVAISQDGSLIAAWFGSKLTLWDTHLCNLRTTLSHPALRPKGIQVRFGNKDAAHYLVCTTENCVAAWSLLSLTVKWMVNLKPTCLTADLYSNRMAVVTTTNDVFVFTPHSSKPVLTQKNLLNPKSGVFKQCTFGSTTKRDIRLYIMRNNSEIYCLEPERTVEGRLEIVSRRNLPASNFSALLAEQQLSEVIAVTGGSVDPNDGESFGNAAVIQFLSGAPHMIPPVSLLCTPFLQQMSGQQLVEPEDDQANEQILEPASSDDENAVPKLNEPNAHKNTELWAPNYEAVKQKRLKKILNRPLVDVDGTATIFGM